MVLNYILVGCPWLACDACGMVKRGVCTFLAVEIASGDFNKTCFKSSRRQKTKALCPLTPPATQTNASSTCLLLNTNTFTYVNSLLFYVLYEEKTMIWYPQKKKESCHQHKIIKTCLHKQTLIALRFTVAKNICKAPPDHTYSRVSVKYKTKSGVEVV